MSEATENLSAAENQGLSAAQTVNSVGGQLRAAREEAKLTLDEVAQSLKFSPRQIELLETDDYASLPGSTIVRGFVRSYARLLKLDADALLRLLDASLPVAPIEVRPPDNMGIASQPRALGELSPLVSVALVLLLASVLLVLWHFFGPSSTRKKAVSPQPELSQTQEITQPAQPVTPPLANGSVVVPAGDTAMPPPANLSGEGAVPALRFVFADRSWVEVTDANKQLLHSGENPGGSQLVLTGRPPFDIVVGNAGKVTLTYGEKAVDLAPHTRAEVARLTLE